MNLAKYVKNFILKVAYQEYINKMGVSHNDIFLMSLLFWQGFLR